MRIRIGESCEECNTLNQDLIELIKDTHINPLHCASHVCTEGGLLWMIFGFTIGLYFEEKW